MSRNGRDSAGYPYVLIRKKQLISCHKLWLLAANKILSNGTFGFGHGGGDIERKNVFFFFKGPEN